MRNGPYPGIPSEGCCEARPGKEAPLFSQTAPRLQSDGGRAATTCGFERPTLTPRRSSELPLSGAHRNRNPERNLSDVWPLTAGDASAPCVRSGSVRPRPTMHLGIGPANAKHELVEIQIARDDPKIVDVQAGYSASVMLSRKILGVDILIASPCTDALLPARQPCSSR